MPAWLGPLLLVLLATAVYAPAARNGFVYDDRALIIEPPAPGSAGEILRVFGERHWKGLPYYRPVPRATMVGQKFLYGNRPAPYHLFNALVMGLAALAAYGLLRRPSFGLPPAAALLGAAAFALHPVASTTVYPAASGRETLIPALLVVASVWAFVRRGRAWYGLALGLFALALLSKEQAVVVPGLFLLADLLGLAEDAPGRRVGRWIGRHLPVAVLLAGYLGVRLALFAGGGEHRVVLLDAPLTPLLSLLFAAQSILDPSVILRYEPRVEVWYSAADLALVLAAAVALGAWTYRRRGEAGRRVIFWLGWFVLALAPTANLLYQETRFAERYAFLALLAPIAGVLTLAHCTWTGAVARRAVVAVGVVLLAGWTAISVSRAPSYADEPTFLEQWLRSDPGSAKAHHAMGQYLYRRQQPEEAARHFREALRHVPEYAAAHSDLGALLAEQGRLDEAAGHFRQAIEIKPRFAFAYNNLASLRAAQGSADEAVSLFERSIELDPTDASVRFALGELYQRLGRTDEARAQLEQAIGIDPGHARAHFALGNLYLGSGDGERAERHFARAAELEDGFAPAHNNLGIVRARRGDVASARREFERALQLDPDYLQAHLNYGNMLLALGETERSLVHLQRAVELAPESKAARESLSRAQAAAGRARP